MIPAWVLILIIPATIIATLIFVVIVAVASHDDEIDGRWFDYDEENK